MVSILLKSDNDRYLNEVKRFIEAASSDDVRAIIFHQIRQKDSYTNTKTKEFLISVAEKKGLFREAQQLVEAITRLKLFQFWESTPEGLRAEFLSVIVRYPLMAIFAKIVDILSLAKNGITSVLRHGCNLLMKYLRGHHNFFR